MARPRKEIKKEQFEKLCALQCTEEEICAVLGVCTDTLEKWCKETYKLRFSEVFKEKRCIGHVSLRRSQMKLAETNPTMAIFLGKNYLGQTDKREEKIEVGADGFLEALKATAEGLNEMSDLIES